MRQDSTRQSPHAPVKAIASRSLRIYLAVLVAVCFFVSGCVKPEQPEQPMVEAPPSPQPAPPIQPQQMPKLQPPRLDEVEVAVKRVFKDAALIDTSRNPNFIAGDFNGDLSQDIAVVLTPAPGKLSEMNQEIPAWMLKDPFVPVEIRMPPLRVEEKDVLLAVIHGYGPDGWRDSQATQTYLLKNAAGSDMKTYSGKEFVARNHGKKLPRLHGDLIGEVIYGASGYLYYAEATYSWYDPKSFKGEPARRLVHAGPAARAER